MTDMITYDDFQKMDIRIGTVLEAENVEKSRNLLKLKVDFGEETPRQVVSGISNDYSPEEVIDRKFAFIVNLQPRKIMGLESQAMILAAESDDNVVLLKVDEKYFDTVKPGAIIG